MSGRSASLAAARYRLARAGYVLTFEVVGEELWCRSCDVTLPVERVAVDASVVVGRTGRGVVRLLAIRSDSPALRGTWLVGASARELRLVHRLLRQGPERSPDRGRPADGAPHPTARASADALAGPGPAAAAARRGGRLVTVTW